VGNSKGAGDKVFHTTCAKEIRGRSKEKKGEFVRGREAKTVVRSKKREKKEEKS